MLFVRGRRDVAEIRPGSPENRLQQPGGVPAGVRLKQRAHRRRVSFAGEDEGFTIEGVGEMEGVPDQLVQQGTHRGDQPLRFGVQQDAEGAGEPQAEGLGDRPGCHLSLSINSLRLGLHVTKAVIQRR